MRLYLLGTGAIVLALMPGAVGSYGSGGKRLSAAALFDRAYSLTNLKAKGSPPFVLKARVTVYLGDHHDDGNYDVTWESDEKVRGEISFPDYHEVSVTNAAKVWHFSTVPYLPYTVFQLNQALYFFGALQISPGTKLAKVREQKLAASQRSARVFLSSTRIRRMNSALILPQDTRSKRKTRPGSRPWSLAIMPRSAIRLFLARCAFLRMDN